MAIINYLTSLICLSALTQAEPITKLQYAEKRQAPTPFTCNQDNCYRQVSRQFTKDRASASSQCSSYGQGRPSVTSYRTVTTISIVGSGILGTHTVFGVTSPFADSPSTTAYNAPPFATACPSTAYATAFTNRFQSACGCNTAGYDNNPSPTKTVYGVPTNIAACDPADPTYSGDPGSDFSYPDPPFRPYGATYKTNVYKTVTDLTTCCRKCYQGQGCLVYFLDYNTLQCTIKSLASSAEYYPNDPICPYGVNSDYLKYDRYGLGPCAFGVVSDE